MVPRVLCLHLPFFAVERYQRCRQELQGRPFCIHRDGKEKSRSVVELSKQAYERGVRPFMSLTEARALCPQIIFIAKRANNDRKALANLAAWARLFGSRTGCHGDDAVAIVLDQSSRYFGGEGLLLEKARRSVEELGYTVNAAIASTPAASHAFAAFSKLSRELTIILPHEEKALLGQLPVHALRLPSELLRTLDTLGLRRISEVFALARKELAARFPLLLERWSALEDMDRDELWQPVKAKVVFQERYEWEHPTKRRREVSIVTRKLLERLFVKLRMSRGHRALRRLQWQAGENKLIIGYRRPRSNPAGAFGVIEEKIDALKFTRPLESLSLRVLETQGPFLSFPDLFETRQPYDALGDLLERLGVRLGEENLCRVELLDDHRPRFRFRLVPFEIERSKAKHQSLEGDDYRPLRLLASPKPVDVRVVDGKPHSLAGHIIDQCFGPERLRCTFWEKLVHRDYFATASKDGAWSWIFQDLESGRWFAHGIFD